MAAFVRASRCRSFARMTFDRVSSPYTDTQDIVSPLRRFNSIRLICSSVNEEVLGFEDSPGTSEEFIDAAGSNPDSLDGVTVFSI
jgi:hypothetical protein